MNVLMRMFQEITVKFGICHFISITSQRILLSCFVQKLDLKLLINMGPLENLWVQSPIFPFNHLISHNKTSKCCCFFSNKICCFCKI